MPHALLVEDDPAALEALTTLVEKRGFSTTTANDVDAARRELSQRQFDAVLLDVHLPSGSGIDLLLQIPTEQRPQVVLLSGDESVRSAFATLPMDALHFVDKPVDPDELAAVLKQVRRRVPQRSARRGGDEVGASIVGESGPIRRVLTLVKKVAATELSVYIEGESGTGKELVAEAIHRASSRSRQPFVAINCGALPENLIDSELFGHERGAFTGADQSRAGVFEQASGGTLFLDEVAEMPTELQVRLLRALETRRIRRVGGKADIEVDVRIVAATNRPFDKAIADGTLREDLFHRLCVFPIAMPPLRDRGGDIELLAHSFLAEFDQRDAQLTERVLAVLRSYSWPGNVRQLRNAMQRAAVLAEGGRIDTACLPEQILNDVADRVSAAADEVVPTEASSGDVAHVSEDGLGIEVGISIAEAERRLIEATLDEMGGDKRSTAEVLGVSLRTLYNRLSEYQAGDDGSA